MNEFMRDRNPSYNNRTTTTTRFIAPPPPEYDEDAQMYWALRRVAPTEDELIDDAMREYEERRYRAPMEPEGYRGATSEVRREPGRRLRRVRFYEDGSYTRNF